MADNTTLNSGSGGDVIATDDIGGVKHQRVKVEFGADGSATDVSPASPLPVREYSDTTAVTSVSASATSVTLKAANTARKGLIIFNDSQAILFVKLGATASSTSYTYALFNADSVEIPFGYTGIVDGIWTSATGAARVTEIT